MENEPVKLSGIFSENRESLSEDSSVDVVVFILVKDMVPNPVRFTNVKMSIVNEAIAHINDNSL